MPGSPRADLLGRNLIVPVTLATAGFGIVAALHPRALTGEAASPGQRYYARMYAARALPLAAAVLLAGRGARANRAVLYAAAAAQLGDVAIGVSRRSPGQIVAPLAGAALYAWRASR